MAPRDDESFASLFENSRSAPIRRRFNRGERVEVTVVVIGKDAVFAELGGKQEGIFELPELAGSDGKLRVSVGSRISAVVVSSDDQTGYVRLSPVFVREAAQDIPEGGMTEDGDVVIPKMKSAPLMIEGAHVKGSVTGVERYGVFVQISGTQGRGGRGLVPSSETGTPRGADLKKHFAMGQEVEAKILNIAEDGKIRLSIAALAADAERGDFEAYSKGDASPKKEGQAPKKPQVRNFGTLGDLLKKR